MKIGVHVYSTYSDIVWEEDNFKFNGSLNELIAKLQELQQLVPEEYRNEARYQFESSEMIEFTISYLRDETEMERKQREARDANDKERIEQQERELYERLKKKYA